MHAIPTIGGSSLPGLSYLGAFRILRNFNQILEEGYRKARLPSPRQAPSLGFAAAHCAELLLQYPTSAFKVATFDRWLVVICGREMVEELRKRPEEELSVALGIIDIVREKLLKKLYSVLPDAVDEVFVAIKDYIPAGDIDWTSIEIAPVVGKILARAGNRIFVGLPLCRDEAYLALAIGFSRRLIKQVSVLRRVPDFLKRRFIAPFVIKAQDDTSRAVCHIPPLIEERMRALEEDREDKPNDSDGTAMDPGKCDSKRRDGVSYHSTIVYLQLWVNRHLIQHLMMPPRARTDYCLYGVRPRHTSRDDEPEGVKDITLHDGTRIPAGTLLGANAHALHRDAAPLADAHTFDAFCYARMRGCAGQSLKHQFASTSPGYIAFGHGPRAWFIDDDHDDDDDDDAANSPGRFFASNILKAALACILLNYDLKPEAAGDGSCPPNARRILFKRRGGSV
uniref:Uncharacterized protein n=1 Tax=Ganoderma boninense TaxID=34458 RepID=A0A5K1K231_9APHY|nr:Uncharacterized protein [Ganoderma boninense]